MWAFTMIPAFSAFFSPNGVELADAFVLRDVAVYMLSLGLLTAFLWDSEVHLAEAGTLLGLYVVYLIVLLVIWPALYPHNPEEHDAFLSKNKKKGTIASGYGTMEEGNNTAAAPAASSSATEDTNKSNGDTNDDADDDEETTFDKVIRIIGFPFVLLFRFTIPNCSEGKGKEKWFWVTFLVSLVYIGLLANFVIFAVKM